MPGTLNALIELFKKLLAGFGVTDYTTQILTAILAILAFLLLIGKQIWVFVKYLASIRRNRMLVKDLDPFYTAGEIATATKYYISTKFQNVPPTEDEEPGRSYIAAATQPLIPLFLNKAFANNDEDNKYYLVLADSGMGKTTFMINLYLQYKLKRVWLWQKPKYNIELFPLGHPNTIQRIKDMKTPEKENCILLLDAFDEDNEAVMNYEKRLNEILDLVWEFKEIVITCRTQFFPSSKEEPTETGRYKFGPDGGRHHFQKIYISPFSEKDIKKYLNKRFSSFFNVNSSKYIKALAIVLKSPNLMMRPMLLSHIDDLVNTKKNLKFGFQIYESLIEQWLNRESNKAGILIKYGDSYKDLLHSFSKSLARDLYLNRKLRNNKLSLKVNEIIDNPNGLQLKDIEGNNIGIDKYDQGSRSLLNRNAVGEYKFSHKSILEYFLALEVFYNEGFRKKFRFDSDLDTAKRFFLEMITLQFILKDERVYTDKDLESMGLFQQEVTAFIAEKTTFVISYTSVFQALSSASNAETFRLYINLIGGISSLVSALTLSKMPNWDNSSLNTGKSDIFMFITLEVAFYGASFYLFYQFYNSIKRKILLNKEMQEGEFNISSKDKTLKHFR